MNSIICPLIYATGATTAFIVAACFNHNVKRWWVYALIFMTIFFGYYIVQPQVRANNIQTELNDLSQTWKYDDTSTIDLSKFRKEYYNLSKVNYHKNKAFQAFCDAEEMCIWLPADKQELAYALFEATVEASVGCAYGGMGGLCAALIIDLTRYGIFVCKNMDKMKAKLEEAEYHFNMAEYYS